MRRRVLLAGCAGALGCFAGCLSDEPDSPADRSSRSETTETTTATPPSVSVSPLSLQPVLVDMNSPDSIGVFGEDQQYLFLDIEVTGDEAPATDEFAFNFDGRETTPYDPDSGFWTDYNPVGLRYDSTRGEGTLAFELPATGDASEAALTWAGGEWTPGATLRERLAAPAPPLSLEWSVPETAEVYDRPTLGFTVTNEGSLTGQFVAALNRTGPVIGYAPITSVLRTVPAGETISFEITDTVDLRAPATDRVGDDESDLAYTLDWAGGHLSREIRLVE
jgi:hypothetical protein